MEKQTINVVLTLTEPMLGTVPMNPEIYREYIESKREKYLDEDESENVELREQKGWTGFHKDEHGIFLYDYIFRGFLKAAGNNLKGALGLKAVRAKIDNFVFVFPRRVRVGKMAPDGVIERPLRAMTMQGPRVTLARSDYIDAGTAMELQVVILDNPKNEINPKVIKELFSYGELCGLGQFRNGSYGRFTVEYK